MAEPTMLDRVKTDLRISHTLLDTDIADMIQSCYQDLAICGVENRSPTDPAIISVVKLYCRANYTDDMEKAAVWQDRYDRMKACLMMASGYREGTVPPE